MNMGPGNRGSISFFSTYRPPVPLDIFSREAPPTSERDEVHLTDGVSYNYNGRVVPPAALKTILKLPKLSDYEGKEPDVVSGRPSGMVFISERRRGLETLHIALRFDGKDAVFSFDDLFPDTFKGVRMEDSCCFAGGDYLLYVSTKEHAYERRQPWTAVYSTNLRTKITERLTPKNHADLSPSLSPSGKKIAVASFQGKDGGWEGENEDLKTNIYVMNITTAKKDNKKGLERKMVVKNGGWPTWGSDNVLFFHRKVGEFWGVFRLDDVSNASPDQDNSTRVTPEEISAMTPTAIDATRVAVATIRQKSEFSGDKPRVKAQYRHIEIFDSARPEINIKITQKDRPLADHYNPFVIIDGEKLSIGYHRANTDVVKGDNKDIPRQFHKLDSPHPDVGLSRVTGVFPTFNSDGSMLAFVDNEFKNLLVANSEGSRVILERGGDKLFSPVWDKKKKDTLYVCSGPSFQPNEHVEIRSIKIVSDTEEPRHSVLISNNSNNAFPSTNPDGTKLVFRSTKDAGENENYKNLYIAEDLTVTNGKTTRLTEGHWTDTHCQWSPGGDWIVFSSNRDQPNTEEDKKKRASREKQPDGEGYFAVYLVKWNDPSVVVRVITSAKDIAGHVNHPFFSPDEKSIVVASDLAAVSADPISLPLFVHSVRPYGDIFTVDVDLKEISRLVDQKSAAGKLVTPSQTPPPVVYIMKDVKDFKRLTHSRYENSTATWSTMPPTEDPNKAITLKLSNNSMSFAPACPYLHPGGGESSHMTGHLFLNNKKRCC